MNQQLFNMLTEMVKIKSFAQNAEELQYIINVVSGYLSWWTIEKFEKNGIHSLLIYKQLQRPSKFKIILNGHLDVVPGKENRYTPEIVENKLYGVGALDMKAGVACLISVFNEVADLVTYPLGLQLVTDEEIGGFNGTKYQIESGIVADFVITAEPTNLDIVNKAKGIINMKITAFGVTAHGAYPWNGTNAILEMNNFLTKLQKEFPVPSSQSWVTTINIAHLETANTSFNKIPDECTVWLDIRYIPEEGAEKVIDNIASLLSKNFRMKIEINEPPLLVSEKNKYIERIKDIAEAIKKTPVKTYGAMGTSDARHYTRIKTDGIEFGPSGGNIGADNEWVDIKSLDTYCEILKTFLINLSEN